MLTDKNHGLMISALSLATEIITVDPSKKTMFYDIVPSLVTRFKALSVNYSDEYLINEVNDPFL